MSTTPSTTPFTPVEFHSAGLSTADYNAVRLATAAARGLPNQAYTDEAFFILERDRLMAATWVCIGFASDLSNPGDARPASLMGLPLLLLRDGETLRVFHNVCSHRGFQLIKEPCELRGSLRCPYHSWTYQLDGALRGTPHIGGPGVHRVDGFEHARHGLKPVRSAVWLDLVFVNLDGRAEPFEQHIDSIQRRWRPFWGERGAEQLMPARSHGRVEFELNTNWKLGVENYCEAYHLPWVHPELNRISKLEDHYNIMADDGPGASFAGQGSRAYNLIDDIGEPLPTLPDWPAQRQRTAEYLALYPNVLLGLQADHAYAVVIEPLAADRCRETMQIYYLPEAAEADRFDPIRQKVQASWRGVFAEDVIAVEGMQQGRASPAYRGGVFSPVMDQPTHHFHRWVAEQVYREGGV